MSRPTLSLPAKASTPALSDEAEALKRRIKKPVRRGYQAPKTSFAERHASQKDAPNAPPARATEQGSAVPSPESNKPRQTTEASAIRQSSEATETRAPNRPARTAREEREHAASEAHKKVYPKRGIARSTGARALPPPRLRDDDTWPAEREAHEPPTSPPRPPAPAPERWVAPRPSSPAREPRTSQAPLRAIDRAENSKYPRLAKRLCAEMNCSRREADEWIENGWVRVDGKRVSTLGARVAPSARLDIDPAARPQERSESVLEKPWEGSTLLFHCAFDPQRGDAATALTSALLHAENHWADDPSRKVVKVAHFRQLQALQSLLDESGGMLVFSQENSVVRRLSGSSLEQEYAVRIEGDLPPDGLSLLSAGVALDGVRQERAQVSWQSEQQLRFVLRDNENRRIQRACESLGVRVTHLKRLRIGSVSLGKVPVGEWRYLRDDERF